MKRIIKFTAASKMMRELLKSGYKVERGAANVSSELSGNVMKIRRGAPLSEFWHESGHALDMHGTADGLKRATAYAEAQAAQKATGAAPNLAYRQQTRDLERRANRTAEQAMTDRGARPEYVQQYRNEVAPHLNDYRKSNSVAAPSGNPANPPGNPGNPGSPIGINTSASPAQQAQPAIPREPIKRSFGGAGLAIGGAGLLAAGGFAAASQKRPKDEEQGFSSKAKLIQFMKNPLHREGIKPGTHRLGGVGVERKVRIRDIVSSQALVDEKKVRKLARFTKNMPGKATVSWNGKNWIAKDGNHRLNAMLKQGKRTATVLVQKLSSGVKALQFAVNPPGLFGRNHLKEARRIEQDEIPYWTEKAAERERANKTHFNNHKDDTRYYAPGASQHVDRDNLPILERFKAQAKAQRRAGRNVAIKHSLIAAIPVAAAGAYAALRKPKDRQLSSPSPLIQFMHNTDQPQPIGIRKRKLIKPRNPIQKLSSPSPLIQFNSLGVGGVLPAWAKWTAAGIGGTSLAIEANRWRDPKHREKRKDVIAPASIGATIGAGLGAKAGFSRGLAETPVEALRSKLGPFPNMAKGAGKGLLKGIIPGAVVGAALTLPIRSIMKKDREMSSKEEIIQLGLAKRAAILGTAGAGAGVSGALLRNPGREIRDDEDVSGKLLWRRSKVPLIRHYGVGVGNNRVAHVQATKIGGSALFKTESLDAFKANRPTYVQASRKVDQAKLREVKKSIRQHNVSAEGFSFLRNNCEIAANGALKLKRPTNQAHDAEMGAGLGAAAGVAAATIIPAVGRIIKKVRQFSARQKLIQFNDDLQPHQQRVIRRITNPKTRGLVVAHGVGSGKTRTSIEAHKALGGDADVVLPAALKGNYEKEIAKWGADSDRISIHSQQALATSKEPLKYNLLIVDEGHRARNPGTKIAQAISASPAKKRMILTGTPIYNNPADIATLVNQAAGKPVMREGKAFHNRYLKPGIFKRWGGGRLSNEGELKKHLNEYVDYHKGDPAFLPTVTAKTVPVEMTKHQSQLYRASMGRIPKGMKLDMENIERLKPYLTGPRQVSNTARALDRTSSDEPKIDKAFSDLQRHLGDPKGKALVYSNWIEHGINPMQQRLLKGNIPHGVFTGNEPMKQRNQTVKDYNDGKHRALLVSSSGAEGLDLKGTRMVQVLEPHFNNAKIRQVVGRSARMNSHAHLPKEDRNVEVRQYVGRPRNRFFRGNSKGVEDMLNDSARDKDEIDKQITRLLSSKRKLIEFGRGDRIREGLIGTRYTETPEGRAELNAMINKKADWTKGERRGPAGDVSAYKNIVPVAQENDKNGRPKRSLMDDAKKQMAKQKEGVINRARVGGMIAKKAIDEHVGPLSPELSTAQKATLRQQGRKTIGGELPKIIKGVRGNLYDHTPRDPIPGMEVERKGKAVPGLVKTAHSESRLRAAKFNVSLRKRVKAGLLASEHYQPGGQYHSLFDPADLDKYADRQARNLMKGAIVAPLVKEGRYDFQNKIMTKRDRASVIADKSHRYGAMAEALKVPQERVEGMHSAYHRMRSPDPKATVKRILNRPDRAAFADTNIPKRTNYGTRPPKTLKKIAIGAGLLGAGMLTKKLLKKKDQPKDQLMSRQGRLIRFGIDKALRMGPSGKGVKPVVGGAWDAMLDKNPKVLALLHRQSLRDGSYIAKPGNNPQIRIQAFRKPGPIAPSEKFHYPEGHPQHSHAAEQYSAANPAPPKIIEARQWTAIQNGKVARAKRGNIGLYGVPDSSVWKGSAPEHSEGLQRQIARLHILEKETIAGTHAKNQRDAKQTAKFLLTPPLKELTSKDAARRYGRAKTAKETRDTRSAMDSERTAHAEAMNSQRSSYESKANEQKSKAKRRLLIGTSAGITGGAGIGYIATRPPKEMEFSAAARVTKAAAKGYAKGWLVTAPLLVPGTGQIGGAVGGVRAGIKEYRKITALPRIEKDLNRKGMKAIHDDGLTGKQREIIGRLQMRPTTRMSAKGDILRFDVSPIQKLRNKAEGEPKASVWSHAATGGIEGAAGIYAVEPLLERYMHGKGTIRGNFIKTLKDTPKGHAKKIAIGAAVGALTTAPIGWAVEKYRKNQMNNRPMLSSKQKLIHFATSSSPVAPGTRTRVAADRYVKQIHERDLDRAEHGYLRTSLGGAAIGALTAKRLGTTKGKAALIGGLAGIGTQALVRHSTAKTKDQFGDRPYTSKLIDRAPGQVAGIAALGLAGKAGYDKLQAAKIAASNFGRKVKIGALGAAGLYAASKLFSANGSNDLIQFEGEDQQIPKGYKLVKEFKKSKPRSWTRKWLADDINIGRRTQDIRTATSRIGNVAKDIGGAIKGEAAVDARGRPRKREWDKPWAQAVKWGALLGATAGGLKMVKHATTHGLGPVGELGEFFRRDGASRYAKGVLSKFPKVEKGVNKVASKVSEISANLKEEGRSVADKVLRHVKGVAGERIPPPHHDVPRAGGGFTRHVKGQKEYDAIEKSLLSKENKATVETAEDAAKKYKRQRDEDINSGNNSYSSNLKPIYFQRLTKEEQRARIDDFRDTSGKEPRLYHNYNAVVEHNALHPSVVQRQPRGPNQETNETRAWKARRRMAYALIAGTAIGASWKRPGLANVAKKSEEKAWALASRDPLIELNSLLDSALL